MPKRERRGKLNAKFKSPPLAPVEKISMTHQEQEQKKLEINQHQEQEQQINTQDNQELSIEQASSKDEEKSRTRTQQRHQRTAKRSKNNEDPSNTDSSIHNRKHRTRETMQEKNRTRTRRHEIRKSKMNKNNINNDRTRQEQAIKMNRETKNQRRTITHREQDKRQHHQCNTIRPTNQNSTLTLKPDSSDTSDSDDNTLSKNEHNIKQRIGKEKDRVSKLKASKTKSHWSDRSGREQDTDTSSATPTRNYDQDNLSVGSERSEKKIKYLVGMK